MCEDDNLKVFGLRFIVTLRESLKQRYPDRHTNCITLHSGIMGTTIFAVDEGMAVCLPSQTQAAIVDVTDPKHPPKY